MEAIAVLSIVLLLFSLVVLEAYRRNGEIAGLEDAYRKRVVCGRLAEAITEAYVVGAGARVDAQLPYEYNVTVYGEGGIISVGDGPSTETCALPSGAMNHTSGFRYRYVNLTNRGGAVEVDGG